MKKTEENNRIGRMRQIYGRESGSGKRIGGEQKKG